MQITLPTSNPVIIGSQVILDNTKRSTFRACKFKFFLAHICGLVPTKGSTALRFGSTWHGFMEGFYLHVQHNGWTKDGSAMEPAMTLAKKVWDTETSDRQFFSDYRTFENCSKMFFEYLNHYYADQSFMQIIAPEEVFNVPIELTLNEQLIYSRIADREIRFTGKIDLKVKLSGLRWAVEHKTTGQEVSVQAQRLNRSAQVMGYTYADRLLHEESSEGTLVSICHCSSRKSKTTGEYGSVKFDFQRPPQVFTPRDLDQWRQEFLDVANDIAQCEATSNWPRCHDSCYQFGQCSYTAICQQNRPVDECNLDGYMVKFWNVEDEG